MIRQGKMVEVKKESKCQICDSYNMKGMWQCECGVDERLQERQVLEVRTAAR